MNIVIDRKSGVPIYIQVKNQILNEIKIGNLKISTKMPTERELAKTLNASRNTISAAYNLLEQEGVLTSYQGRGTFVAEEAASWKQHNIKDKLLKIIDLGLEEALEMGMDTKEFLEIVQNRIKEKEELIKKMSAVFIECNIEQATSFARELSNGTNISIIPMVLSDLRNMDDKTIEILKQAQIIIATFNHVNEVKELTTDIEKDVFGIAINPCIETIVKIARYPQNTKLGLICISNEFRFKIENGLKAAGLNELKINSTTSRKVEDINGLINESDVLIVSPGRYQEVKKLSKNKKEVISFEYNLDHDSVKAVISRVLEIKDYII